MSSLDDLLSQPPAPEPGKAPAEEKAEKKEKKSGKATTGSGKAAEWMPPAATEDGSAKDWYILKVQSNREDSIRDALERRVRINGLEMFVDKIIVPVEKVQEINPKTNKKRTVKRKLYPGYIVVFMEINDKTWYLIRETSGIGDFAGAAGRPAALAPHEVSRIVSKSEETADVELPRLRINFKPGDRVKIIDGIFVNFEGDIDHVDESKGQVTVLISIFNRTTPYDLDYWQVEAL